MHFKVYKDMVEL